MKKVFNISLEIWVESETNGLALDENGFGERTYWGDERAKEQIGRLLLSNLPEFCRPKVKVEVKNENN